MKRIFLGLMAAGMLAACNQSNKATQAAATTVTTSAASAADAPGSVHPVVSSAEAANAPFIKFDSDTYAFGKIKQGDKVTHDFKFTNTGKSPLIITNAVASCGCTTPEWPKEPIKPGEAGVIKVTFNSANKAGLQDKLITITSNTVPATTMAHLTGEVIAPK